MSIDRAIQSVERVCGEYTHILYTRLIDAGCKRPESPIEEMMLAAMCGMAMMFRDIGFGDIDLQLTRHPTRRFDIFPQHKVGSFRLDFAIRVSFVDLPGKERWIALELDGHEFHERTPEQAERDKSRDRELARLGYTVLRFAGREVYRDAAESLNDVYRVALRLSTDLRGGEA